MNLTGIISISGKSGLYKVVGQGKNTIIVEALDSGKRFPTYASHKISALDDISVYCYEEDVPLKDVYEKIAENSDYKETISHKESAENLVKKLDEIIPDWDEDRVYMSDIKKLFQWFNLLVKNGLVKKEEEEKKEEKPAAKKAPAKKPAAKKAAVKKPVAKAPAAKKAPAKKAAAKKPVAKKK
jgi:superfamily I DNA/RNA helicase